MNSSLEHEAIREKGMPTSLLLVVAGAVAVVAIMVIGFDGIERITPEKLATAQAAREQAVADQRKAEVIDAINKGTLLKGMTKEEAEAALKTNLRVLVREGEGHTVAYRAVMAERMYIELLYRDGRLVTWAQNY